MATFGPLISGPVIEDGVEHAIRTWLGDYLGQACVDAGMDRDFLPDPTDLRRASEVDWRTEAQMMLAVVASLGTEDDATSMDAEHYSMTWDVRPNIVVSLPGSSDPQLPRRAAQVYATAMLVLLSHKGLDWPDEYAGQTPETTVIPRGVNAVQVNPASEQTAAIWEARVSVIVQKSFARYGGPSTPTTSPGRSEGDPVPTALTFTPTLSKIPLVPEEDS